jgi:xylitol oxidase
MSREHNWTDNYSFLARRLHRPDTVDALRRIVAGASHVHALGARHSFNGIADTAGDLIDLGGLPPDFALDRQAWTVTASAGASYGAVAAFLQGEGWALLNMPSLPHVTLAGATATGTHGSGDRLGTLSSAVAALELVTATGDLVTFRRGDPAFDGVVVNVGALGIVTRMTLDIQPGFMMRQDAFEGLAWERVVSDLDAVMSAGESVSLMTHWAHPTVERMWVKTRDQGSESATGAAARLGATPAARPLLEDVPGLNPFGVPGPWPERLPHFRRDVEPGKVGHLQSEYLLPRARATEAIAVLRGIGATVDRHLLISEIRSMCGDALWLSPAYGAPAIGLHFSWERDIEAVARITAEVEALLLPLGARPHWGKIIHTGASGLAPLYPKLADFRALVQSLDPSGKFANEFLRVHVLGDAPSLGNG